MQPRIQYAKTTDGVSIAFCTLGSGPALVHLPTVPFSHLALEWQIPEYQEWYKLLGHRRMLVRYDNRGSGLSQREISQCSLEDLVLDLDAVRTSVGLDRFELFAGFTAGPVALAFAARYPQQVARVVLWCTWARGIDMRVPRVSAVQDMLPQEWMIYTETLAHVLLGWSSGEPARQFAAYMRECVSQTEAHLIFHEYRKIDVSRLLPTVGCPVLIVHRRGVAFPDVSLATALAGDLPDARLALLEGSSGAPYLGDTDEVIRVIDDFLEEESARPYPDGLSGREVEVLRLIAAGRSNREIAEHLTISLHTVVRHVSNILAKTGSANRAEAATYANRHQLLPS